MSIIDRVTSNLSNLMGKGPPGLPGPHNTSWGTTHDRSHGGEGSRGFPGGPGQGGLNHGTQRPGGNIGQGPPGLPGLPAPPGLPGIPGTPGTDRPGPAPGYGHGVDRPGGPGNPGYGVDRPSAPGNPGYGVDRPNAPGNPGNPGYGVDRPNAPGNPGYGVDRPNAPGHQGHGADRPNGPGNPGYGAERPNQVPSPGQMIRDLLGVPRQTQSQVPSQPQAPTQPGPAQPAPVQTGPAQSPGLSGQMVAAALAAPLAAAQTGPTGHAAGASPLHAPLAQQSPAQLAAAAAPRADVATRTAQARADALPQAVLPGQRADAAHLPARPDAALAPRPQDTGMANLQRTAGNSLPPTASSPGATTPGPTVAASTAATTAAASAATVVAGTTMANAPPAAPQAAEVRNPGNPLAVNDRGTPARPDVAGYTGEGPQRRGLERSPRALPGSLSTLLVALGTQGHTGASGRDRAAAERELREATMQWMFWLLAVIAYGCLGFAVVALLPTGTEVLGDSARTWTGGSALVGLFTAAVAWLLAKKLSARKG